MTRKLIALVLFGISFGYLEAAVVVYLRVLYEPSRMILPSDELFPLSPQLVVPDRIHARYAAVEAGREAATIAMLFAVALMVSRNAVQCMGAFALAFGVWDITFYACLKLLIAWPASLFTWDILFMLPVPWVGPVIAPLLVSIAMIACGVYAFMRHVHIRMAHWGGILVGAVVLIVAFAWDYRNIVSGGYPNPFHWTVFWAGLALGVASFIAAAATTARSQTQRDSGLPERSPENAQSSPAQAGS